MKLKHVAALLILGLFGRAHQAFAQRAYAVGIGGGASIPTGRFNDVQSTGKHGIIFLALGVPDLPLGVRFDGAYRLFGHKTPTPAAPGPADLRVVSALGNLIFTFPGSAAKTYILVGAGLYNIKPDTTGGRSKNHVGFNAGLGSVFGVGPLAVFLESRYHSVSRKTEDGGMIHFIPITLGLMF